MIQPIIINGQQIIPEQIRYDQTGVWVGDQHTPSDNPRLEFARLLGAFTDTSIMEYNNRSQIAVRNNTIMNWNKVLIGIGCIIGGNGFGYERTADGGLITIQHLGHVIIEDGVVLHNNVCVDRAVIGRTMIGAGSKIDNLVHVAHGVQIGRDVLVVAGTVLGGRCEVGDRTFVGMNVSVKQSVKIGAGCVIGAGAVVLRDVPDNQVWVGNPAKYLRDNK